MGPSEASDVSERGVTVKAQPSVGEMVHHAAEIARAQAAKTGDGAEVSVKAKTKVKVEVKPRKRTPRTNRTVRPHLNF